MSNNSEITYLIFGIVTLILITSSFTGYILKQKVQTASHVVIDNLNNRINAWWVMLIVLFSAILFGKLGLIILFTFISFFALREFITLLPTRRSDHFALSIAFYILLPFQYYLVYANWYGLYSILIPLYAFLLIPIAILKYEDTAFFLERSAKIHWGLMVSVFCISHVPALLNLKLPHFTGDKVWLIMWLILVVQASDVLQYIFGKLFGKRKISSQLSPSKTIEGLIGGVSCAMLIGYLSRGLTPFNLIESITISFIICIFGFLGALVMSAIKRDRGVKDWGNLIKGHGGMLDRMDSICFSAPIYFHIIRYWFNA